MRELLVELLKHRVPVRYKKWHPNSWNDAPHLCRQATEIWPGDEELFRLMKRAGYGKFPEEG